MDPVRTARLLASGSLVGGLAGESFLSSIKGLGFVLTALFVVLALDAYQNSPDIITLTLAAVCAVIARVLAPGSMLLLAMSLFAGALIVRHHVDPRPVEGDLHA